MKKPYLKRLKEIPPLTVWLVDGNYVRTNIDEQFPNCGQHYYFKKIPVRELWIDKEYAPGELNFFIDHLLVERRLMAKGWGYCKAITKADQVEQSEREKSSKARRWGKKPKAELIDRIHLNLLQTYSTPKLKVWLVDGELVRDLIHDEFNEAGHDLVYKFIPKGEIWLDNDLNPRERKFALVHELFERSFMAKGWEYHAAHYRKASVLEYYCRHHPKETEKKIKQLLVIS